MTNAYHLAEAQAAARRIASLEAALEVARSDADAAHRRCHSSRSGGGGAGDDESDPAAALRRQRLDFEELLEAFQARVTCPPAPNYLPDIFATLSLMFPV
jgi:hypothetical protein